MGDRTPAAASGAARLGSRGARRQIRSVLADAAGAGAYSVGFNVTCGAVTGFTVYLSGDFAGAGERVYARAAASSAARAASQYDAHALPTARVVAASPAPLTAAKRRRGCRAGARHQQRRHKSNTRMALATHAPPGAAPSGMGNAPDRAVREVDGGAVHEPPAPHASSPRMSSSSSAYTSSSLSSRARSFVPSHLGPPPPPPPPCSPPPPLPSEAPSHPVDPLTDHLFPHAALSYEEERWAYYQRVGHPASSSKKRAASPPPSSSSSPFIVDCIVNERAGARAGPPAPRKGGRR